MKFPTKLKIGPHSYTFNLVPMVTIRGYETKLGVCSYADQLIEVKGDMPDTLVAETALHEIMHAVRDLYDISTGAHEEEHQVEVMGITMTQVFRDNKKFFDWWRSLL